MKGHLSRCWWIICFGCLLGLVEPVANAQVNVTTQHNDNSRSGANTQETVLTPANVNSTQFGKLFSLTVDGYVYAQPLYLSGVTISGGTHNVLYIVTEHDSVYAIDADSGAILWHDSFINPPNVETLSTTDVNCSDIKPEIGITTTPAIDTSTNTIYVLARTKELNASGTYSYFQRLHAIDTLSGAEKFGGPVAIQASVAGTGDGSSGGTLAFDPLMENPRAGLLLQFGHVIMAWSSLCDNTPFHGWVMSYSAGALAQEAVFNDTPNGSDGGIWQAGTGLAGDANGNTFLATGNGTFNGTDEFGDSILKLGAPVTTSDSFPLADFFTPFNQATLASEDLDVGSGGVVLLPDLPAGSPHEHLLVEAGKEGTIYLIDRDNMGKYCNGCSSDTNVVQELPQALAGQMGGGAYWNGNFFIGSERQQTSVFTGVCDHMKAFSFNSGGSGLLSTSPTSQTSESYCFPAVSPAVSANGTSNGIVWMLDNVQFSGACCAVMHAYDATNLATELYNTNQNSSRDGLGSGVKFTVPTIANGKVYVPGLQVVTAYGLLSPPPPPGAISLAGKAYGAYHNAATPVASISSSGLPLPANDLLVATCGINSASATTPTVSDTAGNSFLQAGTTLSGSGGDSVSMFYAANAKAASPDKVTCSWGAPSSDLAVMALAYSGADLTNPLDAIAGGTDHGTTTLQTSAFSTNSANEVIVAGMMSASSCNPTPTPGSGYTLELAAIPSGCTGPLAATEDEIVSAQKSGAVASLTFASNTWADMVAATFKADTSGGGTPTVSLSPTSLTFASQQVGTTSSAQSVTLTNSGSGSLSINGITITGTNPGDFAETNNCGSAVAAGASCTINVTFTPTQTGTRSAAVTISDNASGSPQSVGLSGTGSAPAVSLTPASLTFGSQTVNTTSAAQAVTLSNSGSSALSISSVAISGDFAQTNNCGSSLAAGTNCTINVTFTPTATGTRTGTLSVTDNASNSPQTASLTGTGAITTGAISLATKAYGAYHNSSTPASSVTSGAFAVSSGALIVAYCGNSASTAATPAISDKAGNVFHQVGATAAGSGGDSLAMFYAANANASSSDSITCQWSTAQINLAVMALVYTGADSSAPLDATASGFSKGATSIQTAAFSTSSASEVMIAGMMSGSGCIAAPTPGSGYTMELDAIPSGCAGPEAATEDKVVSTQQSSVTASMTFSSGTWADMIAATFKAGASSSGSPAASVSPTSLTFASQNVGTTSAAQAVTLSNTGSASLSISSIAIMGANSSDFAQTNNCGSSVAAGANCTINVTFSPSASGTRTASLAVSDNASGSPQTVSLTGTGASVTGSPAVSLSPTSLTFGSQTVETTSSAQTVTLSNTGTATLSISSIAITGTNSGDFGETNNCGASVAAGSNCSINVTFTPTAGGTRTASLAVTDNASGSPQSVSLTGTGQAASTAPAFVQVQNNIDTSGTAFTSFSVPITTAAGDLLVAFVRESSNGTDNFTVTDSAGQTWTLTSSGYKNESSSGPRLGMFYVANSAAVTSVTVHYTTSNGVIKPGIMVLEISGAAVSGVADGSVSNASGASVTTSSSGALTTTSANDILILATDTAGNETGWTAGTGFAIPNNKLATGASGSNIRMAMQFAVVSAVQTNTTTSMSYPSAAWNGNIFAAFK